MKSVYYSYCNLHCVNMFYIVLIILVLNINHQRLRAVLCCYHYFHIMPSVLVAFTYRLRKYLRVQMDHISLPHFCQTLSPSEWFWRAKNNLVNWHEVVELGETSPLHIWRLFPHNPIFFWERLSSAYPGQSVGWLVSRTFIITLRRCPGATERS